MPKSMTADTASVIRVPSMMARFLYLLMTMALAASAFAAIAAAPAPAAIPVTTVVEREWQQTYTAEGVVEAVRQTSVAAQTQGAILALNVKAGDSVRAGDVLVRIDARSAEQQVAASTSQVAHAEALLANAQARHQRNLDLVQKGFVSKAAVDQSEADLRAAQAERATARANAEQSRTARSYTVVTAPYPGVVGSTEVQVGDMAAPGKPLLTLFDPRELRVSATVPQSVLARVRMQAPAAVEIPATGLRVTPVRVAVVPLADTQTHTARVRLDLPPTEGVLPGHYARARFVTGTLRAMGVPSGAIVRRGEVTAVYVVDAAGRPRLRQVRLGEPLSGGADGSAVQVLAGLRAGERVALDPIAAGMLTASIL